MVSLPIPGQSRWRFPDPATAGEDGLVGIGADLAPATLVDAYRQGNLPLAAPGGAAALVLARPARGDPARRGGRVPLAARPAAPLGLGDDRRPRLRRRPGRLRRPRRDLDYAADAGRLPAAARPRPRPQPRGVGRRRE